MVHEIKLKVPFHDVDQMHVVWHGNYLKYFDMARFALFESVGIHLIDFGDKHHIQFPIVKTSTKHVSPLRYNDEFWCRATVLEAYYKLVLKFEIRLINTHELCAKGTGEQVAVKVPEMDLQFEIPETIRFALGFE